MGIIVSLLFPARASGNRTAFDFSRVSVQEFTSASPKIHTNDNHIVACLSYKAPLVRALVWQIKTKRDRHAFILAGQIMGKKLSEILARNKSRTTTLIPIIIPMPISRKRRRERGYNQCELLAGEIGIKEIEIRTDILFRNKQKNITAKKQAFKNRSERISGMKGVFSTDIVRLHKIENYENRHFIIIDDVLTTGSTMNEAILTLRNSGCKNVSGLALAH